MASPNLSKILDEAKALTVEEQQELARLLAQGSQKPVVREPDDLERLLLKKGLITSIPSRNISSAEFRSRELLKIQGKPVSETLIEERR